MEPNEETRIPEEVSVEDNCETVSTEKDAEAEKGAFDNEAFVTGDESKPKEIANAGKTPSLSSDLDSGIEP